MDWNRLIDRYETIKTCRYETIETDIYIYIYRCEHNDVDIWIERYETIKIDR